MDAAEKYRQFAGMKVPSPFVIWLGWIVWLPFLAIEISDVLRAHPPGLILAVTLTSQIAFGGLYAWGTWQNARDLKRFSLEEYREQGVRRWPLITILVVLSLAIMGLGSSLKLQLLSPFIYTAAYVAGVLRPRQVLVTNLVILVLGMVGEWAFNGVFFGFGAFLIVVVTFCTAGWEGAFLLARQLAVAQAQIEAMAVGAERLRIARDLHDLLGQKLSLITLKSQLGRKLVRTNPSQAEQEFQDVEQTAREVLQEVREAVGRYRSPTVPEEIQKAQELLTAAGIDFDYVPTVKTLPEVYDEVLAWAVREGVTNVVRHSRAKHCRIRINEGTSWTLVISDDGQNSKAHSPGHGLRGLETRLRTVGGHSKAEAQPSGFELSIDLPLVPQDARR